MPDQPLDDDEEEDEDEDDEDEDDDAAEIWHGGAVTALLSDGRTCPCVGGCDDDELLELLELLLLELELLELLTSIVHGGTTSRSMSLFSAITSWFWTLPPLDCGVLPPGDMRIVLTAC